MKRTVRDLLRQRPITQIPEIEILATLEHALAMLEAYDSGALLVMSSGQPVAVFSEKDFARWAIKGERHLDLKERLANLVNRRLTYVTPEYRLEECMAVMSKLRIRHLPVLENGRAIALLSMRHILEALIEDKEFLLGEMMKFVTGSTQSEQIPGAETWTRDVVAMTLEEKRS